MNGLYEQLKAETNLRQEEKRVKREEIRQLVKRLMKKERQISQLQQRIEMLEMQTNQYGSSARSCSEFIDLLNP